MIPALGSQYEEANAVYRRLSLPKNPPCRPQPPCGIDGLPLRNEEVRGSIPLGSTTASPGIVAIICLLPNSLPCEFWATRPPTRPLVWATYRPSAAGRAICPTGG